MYRDYAETILRKFESSLNMLSRCKELGMILAYSELKCRIETAMKSFEYMRAAGCWESVTSTQKLVNSAIDCFQLIRKSSLYRCEDAFLRVGRCLYDIQSVLNMIEYNELGVF